MGADLYAVKNGIEYRYFRDCYNPSGLFAVMSANLDRKFSWWETIRRKDLFPTQPRMTPAKAKKWLKELRPFIEEFQAKQDLIMNDTWEEKIVQLKSDDVTEYHRWAQELVDLLEKSIELKCTIIWSV